MTLKASWIPSDDVIKNSNIHKMMLRNGFTDYEDFWKWSVDKKPEFWSQTVDNLQLKFIKKYTSILDINNGVEQATWLKDAT